MAKYTQGMQFRISLVQVVTIHCDPFKTFPGAAHGRGVMKGYVKHVLYELPRVVHNTCVKDVPPQSGTAW